MEQINYNRIQREKHTEKGHIDMKEIYAVLPSAEQGNFFHFELSSA